MVTSCGAQWESAEKSQIKTDENTKTLRMFKASELRATCAVPDLDANTV
jgi:hypothetical protein